MRRSHIFLRNISFTLFARIWRILLPIITTPYIVYKLGTDAYGIMSILTVFAGYFSLMNFGIGTAATKYIAEYLAKKDEAMVKKISQVGSMYYGLFAITGGFLVLLGFLFVFHKYFHIPSQMVQQTERAFFIVAAIFPISTFVAYCNSIIKGYQHFHLLTYRTVISYTFSVIFTVIALFLGYGIVAVVSVTLIFSILNFIVFWFILKRYCPEVSLIPKWDLNTFLKLFHFSKWKLFGGATAMAAKNAATLFIGAILNVTQVAYFSIAQMLAQAISRQFGSAINQVIYPIMSESVVIDSKNNQRELYFRTVKWNFSILAVPTVYIIVYGDIILDLWIGADFSLNGSFILRMLSAFYLITSITWLGVSLFEANGIIRFPNLMSVVITLIQLLLYFLLIPSSGINGVVWSLYLSLPIAAYFQHSVIKLLQSSWVEFFSRCILRSFLSCLIVILLLYISRTVIFFNLLTIIIFSIVSTVLQIAIYYILGVVDKTDKDIIKSYIVKSVALTNTV